MVSRAALARALPFLAYMAFIVVADVLGRAGVGAEQLRWLYPVKVGVVAALLWYFRKDYTELAAGLSPRAAVAALLCGVLVLLLWINLNASWMQVGTAAGFDPRDGGRLQWPLLLVRLAGAALVVPLMEELFWRSFLMRWIAAADFLAVDPRTLQLRSFIVTVILFGFEHNMWLAGIIAGAFYSLLYMRTRNLWSAILAHAVTNGLLGIWVVWTGSWQYW